VLKGLWHRGLKRVLLFISDGLVGLQPAIQRVYPLAEWPRCVVHGVRSGLSQVRDRGPLAEDLRRVYQAESRTEALGALEELQARWGGRYPGVRLWWVCASTTTPGRNPMERLIREMRRGTRVRDTGFPAKGLTSCCTWSAKGKKGSGRRGSSGDLRRPKRHWSRCCGSGTSPVHRLLHINLDTTGINRRLPTFSVILVAKSPNRFTSHGPASRNSGKRRRGVVSPSRGKSCCISPFLWAWRASSCFA